MANKNPASDILRSVARQQENTLEAMNDFRENSNEYGATNEDVLKDKSIDGTYIVANMGPNFYSPNNEYKSPE